LQGLDIKYIYSTAQFNEATMKGTMALLRQGVSNIGGKVVGGLKPPFCKKQLLASIDKEKEKKGREIMGYACHPPIKGRGNIDTCQKLTHDLPTFRAQFLSILL
jgi:hypothetical protein